MAIRTGILGLARREGTFAEVGLRSWEEAGCGAVERALTAAGDGTYVVHRPLVLRSSRPEVERILRDWCDSPSEPSRCDLILTVGGTGYAPADVMPEATAAVVQRAAPGLAELLRRAAGEGIPPQVTLSRGLAGMRGRTLLINLPGAAKGMADGDSLSAAVALLLPLLPDLVAAVQE